MTVSEVMEPPFPIVDMTQPVDAVAKLLSKSNPAVLVRSNGTLHGIVTRSDMLARLAPKRRWSGRSAPSLRLSI